MREVADNVTALRIPRNRALDRGGRPKGIDERPVGILAELGDVIEIRRWPRADKPNWGFAPDHRQTFSIRLGKGSPTIRSESARSASSGLYVGKISRGAVAIRSCPSTSTQMARQGQHVLFSILYGLNPTDRQSSPRMAPTSAPESARFGLRRQYFRQAPELFGNWSFTAQSRNGGSSGRAPRHPLA